MLPLGLIKKGKGYIQQFAPAMKLNEKNLELYSISPIGVDKKGYLNKRGDVNPDYQKRWFVLKGNLLFYFDKESDRKPNGVIILDSCTIELADDPEVPYPFLIVFSGAKSRNYVLAATSEEEMQSWMRALTCAAFSVTKSLVDSLEAKFEEARNLKRCSTEAGNKRISKLRPFSTLQVNDQDARSLAQTMPLRPPRRPRDDRKNNVYTENPGGRSKEKASSIKRANLPVVARDIPAASSSISTESADSHGASTHCSRTSVHIGAGSTGLPDATAGLSAASESQPSVSEDRASTSVDLATENFIPVDVYALSQNRPGGPDGESESTFYTCLHYFTPPTVGEFLDKNDPLDEEEIFDVPMKPNSYEPPEELIPVSTLSRNKKLLSRHNQFSKSERRPTTRHATFHADVDLWRSKDDSGVGRSVSSFRNLHDSFGVSIWVKVQTFEAAITSLQQSSSKG